MKVNKNVSIFFDFFEMVDIADRILASALHQRLSTLYKC